MDNTLRITAAARRSESKIRTSIVHRTKKIPTRFRCAQSLAISTSMEEMVAILCKMGTCRFRKPLSNFSTCALRKTNHSNQYKGRRPVPFEIYVVLKCDINSCFLLHFLDSDAGPRGPAPCPNSGIRLSQADLGVPRDRNNRQRLGNTADCPRRPTRKSEAPTDRHRHRDCPGPSTEAPGSRRRQAGLSCLGPPAGPGRRRRRSSDRRTGTE